MNVDSDLLRHRREFLRALANHRYEQTAQGLLFPEQRLIVGGVFIHNVNGGPDLVDHNLVPTEGLNHVLDVVLHDGTKISTWYVALFKGNVTPQATWTAANWVANATELTEYDETTRQAYVEGAPAAGAIDNLASRAVFTINATVTCYGASLASASAKSATTGTLFASTRFTTSRSLADNDVFNVGYAVTATST